MINVWTPGCDGQRRPVIVQMPHHSWGTTANEFDNLVSRGDVVAVSFNHRQGITGHMYLGQIGGEEYAESGNAGTLDIISALQWIRDNIESFGGDPDRVLIHGCSGSAVEATMIAAAPKAEGLFNRALISDGSMQHAWPPFFATLMADRVLHGLGIAQSELHRLQDVPWQQLHESLADYGELAFQLLAPTPRHLMFQFSPVADGVVLPGELFSESAPECSSNVQMMIGTSRDSVNAILSTAPWLGYLDEHGLRTVIESNVGPAHTDAIITAERNAQPDATPTQLLLRFAVHRLMLKKAVEHAEYRVRSGQASTYVYRFDFGSSAMGGAALHCAEFPFFFNNIGGGSPLLTDLYEGQTERDGVQAAIHEAFVHFAATGDPNHDGIPNWEPYSLEQRATMIFDDPCELAYDPDSEIREAHARVERGWGDEADYVEALKLVDNFIKLPTVGLEREDLVKLQWP